MLRKLASALFPLLFLASVALVYDNVLSDAAPISAAADRAACTVKPCARPHHMASMSRNALGQSFEFAWPEGRVPVRCSREYLLFGERRCTAY